MSTFLQDEINTWVRRGNLNSVETNLQISFYSPPERSESMLAVNFGFGGILERVISKVVVEIGQWGSLGEKYGDSTKTSRII